MEIKFTKKISVGDYNFLRSSVGWKMVEAEQAKKGIKNSAYICVANVSGKNVGMARVITDGGCIVFIADVIVHPDYQGMGIGNEIMSRVMKYVEGLVNEGQFVYVSLMAAKGKEGFYERFGFTKRPNENYGCGMTQNIER